MAATQSVRDGSDTGQPDTRPRVLHVGYLPDGVIHGVACDRPLRVVLSDRPGGPLRVELWQCNTLSCRPCSARYRRKIKAVAEEGFTRPPVDGDHYSFVTVTPPGDSPHCMKAGCESAPFCKHQQCPCTPWEGTDLAEWNPTAGKRWNLLLLLIERHYGARPEYFRPVEVQDGKRRTDGVGRGGLHLHPLLRTPYAIDERTFRKLAIAAGFGHEVRVVRVDRGSRALVQYVTKRVAGYVTKSGGKARDGVPWMRYDVDQETGEVTEQTRPTYRTWSQSRGWGTTMAKIRERSRLQALELAAQRQAGQAGIVTTAGAEPSPVENSPPHSP